jgi:CheY-like chemotaxis protein
LSQITTTRPVRDLGDSGAARRLDRCAGAKSGPETIALVQQHRPDMMVMDLNMPGLGGIDTCAKSSAASSQ